jgi:hypothetical protein
MWRISAALALQLRYGLREWLAAVCGSVETALVAESRREPVPGMTLPCVRPLMHCAAPKRRM